MGKSDKRDVSDYDFIGFWGSLCKAWLDSSGDAKIGIFLITLAAILMSGIGGCTVCTSYFNSQSEQARLESEQARLEFYRRNPELSTERANARREKITILQELIASGKLTQSRQEEAMDMLRELMMQE